MELLFWIEKKSRRIVALLADQNVISSAQLGKFSWEKSSNSIGPKGIMKSILVKEVRRNENNPEEERP